MNSSDHLDWVFLPFDQLSTSTLYEILALRQEVFVVGQSCLYLDADGVDQSALHLCGYNRSKQLCAYLRAFPSTEDPEEIWKVGRVLVRSNHRGKGLGKALMTEIQSRLRARGITTLKLSAQAYLERFYQDLGFTICGSLFDDVGIPHVPMRTELTPYASLEQVTHIAFDLDGTLIDSSYDYALCFEQLALEWGRPRPSSERIRSLMFAGLLPQLKESLGELTPEETIQAVERFRAICIAQPLSHTQFYPGTLALLEALKDRGIKLCVCTNRPHDLAEQVLGELGILNEFELVVGGDHGLERKPSPDMIDHIKFKLKLSNEQLCMVGDSLVDLEASHASGIVCAAVTWGYTKATILEQAQPTLLLNHPKQLLTSLEHAQKAKK